MRKKSYLFASGLLAVLPTLCFAATESNAANSTVIAQKAENVQKTPFEPFTGKIIANRVRLRTQPNLEGNVVKELNSGDVFAVIGEDNGYFAVRAPKGLKGYVFRTFVLEDTVEGARVNVRLQPDTDAPIIGQLNSGDKIKGALSSQNNKWLEIDPPTTSHFFIAKEYIEKIGGIDLLEKQELRRAEATQLLNTALLFSQSELRKPFEEIDLDRISKNFDKVNEYSDIPEIVEKAKETQSLIQETYIQKKIAFLESKADRTTVSSESEKNRMQALAMEKSYSDKLSQIGMDLTNNEDLPTLASATVDGAGNSVSAPQPKLAHLAQEVTDKMRIWEPLEEAIFQNWTVSNSSKSKQEFYEEELLNATALTGIVESYNRPVKNRPGDFILRIDNLPVAFLYSTSINLQDKVGQKVTVIASPRPNNNFAFPAYYVLSIE